MRQQAEISQDFLYCVSSIKPFREMPHPWLLLIVISKYE